MKKSFLKIIATYITFLLLFIVERLVFVLFYGGKQSLAVSDWVQSFVHGFPLDASVAGYLTILPALLSLVAMMSGSLWVAKIEKIYYVVASVLVSLIFCLDIVLYSFWGFRLDSTPIFYFVSSPGAAMASASAWQTVLGCGCIAGVAATIYFLLAKGVGKIKVDKDRNYKSVIVTAMLTAALFIPIRGGFTVAAMNVSRAYFSTVPLLNHAAVNPAFNLLYTLTHQLDTEQFHYMDSEKASAIFRTMHSDSKALDGDTLLANSRPDIYIVLLESFSAHLMPSLGGEQIALGLDSVARQGLLFTRCYATGIRTDRAIPAVVSGFPAQPSMSIMKYVEKSAALPSLAAELKKEGYSTSYYYGGDANFTNMQAFLVNAGFDRIISDKDFPLSMRLSKWGAPDHLLFDRVYGDMLHRRGEMIKGVREAGRPQLTVVQTSSSHEPFEVPYENKKFAGNKRLNAFAYTDKSATDFLNLMHAEGFDRDAIVILVADHFGVYPENPKSDKARFHIPLIMTGGALHRKGEVDNVTSQCDIAATLLCGMGLDASGFKYSKNALDNRIRHFAPVAGNGTFGLVDSTDLKLYDCSRNEQKPQSSADKSLREARAYLQTLYEDIESL